MQSDNLEGAQITNNRHDELTHALNMSEEKIDLSQVIPKKERYTYLALLFQHFLGSLGVCVLLWATGVAAYNSDRGGCSVIPIGILGTLFFLAAEKSLFVRNLPLKIDETGIYAMVFGRTWKSIPWSDVQCIEKIKTTIYTPLKFRDGYKFLIVGTDNQIQLDDTIYKLPNYEKYPAILHTLNFYVQQHNIPLVAYDRGEDTKKKIEVTVMDKQQRKKLLKEGVKTSITSL